MMSEQVALLRLRQEKLQGVEELIGADRKITTE
jgi:hypothetical protein